MMTNLGLPSRTTGFRESEKPKNRRKTPMTNRTRDAQEAQFGLPPRRLDDVLHHLDRRNEHFIGSERLLRNGRTDRRVVHPTDAKKRTTLTLGTEGWSSNLAASTGGPFRVRLDGANIHDGGGWE